MGRLFIRSGKKIPREREYCSSACKQKIYHQRKLKGSVIPSLIETKVYFTDGVQGTFNNLKEQIAKLEEERDLTRAVLFHAQQEVSSLSFDADMAKIDAEYEIKDATRKLRVDLAMLQFKLDHERSRSDAFEELYKIEQEHHESTRRRLEEDKDMLKAALRSAGIDPEVVLEQSIGYEYEGLPVTDDWSNY